jgi:sulfatase modifying factor 1
MWVEDRRAKRAENMVLVPAGEFLMGDDAVIADEGVRSGDWLSDSHPQRVIYMSAFLIDRYPVTNAQYRQFLLDTGYPAPYHYSYGLGSKESPDAFDWYRDTAEFPRGTGKLPVVRVSWHDASAYCEWAGVRLPTEAEWEKAARGTDGRPYPWGWDQPSPELCHITTEEQRETSSYRPRNRLQSVDAHPRGQSPFGCCDMLGNVEEWCADWYAEDYYSAMPARDPKGPEQGECRVARGLSHIGSVFHIALRDQWFPWGRTDATGFRCVISADAS